MCDIIIKDKELVTFHAVSAKGEAFINKHFLIQEPMCWQAAVEWCKEIAKQGLVADLIY